MSAQSSGSQSSGSQSSGSQSSGKRRADGLDKAIAAGLLVAVVFTALAHGAVEPWSVFIFELIVLALVMLWAIKSVEAGRLRIMIPDAARPVAALVVVALAQSVAFTSGAGRSMSLSRDVGATRAAVTVLIFLLISFMIAANFFAGRRRLSGLAKFLIVYGLAMALFALVQHFTWDGRFYWLRPTESTAPFGPFANHNHFAGYLEMLIPLPVALVITRGLRAEWRLLAGFAAVMMSLAAIASLSRGGMISLFAAMMFILFMSVRHPHLRRPGARTRFRLASQTAVIIALVAVIVAGIFWIGADPVIKRVTQGQVASAAPQAETFFSSRGWVWRDTLNMIRANPLLGVGLGAYGTAFSIYTESDGSLRVPQAHNDYLQVVADCGIVGGLIALWFIAALLSAVVRGVRSRDPLLSGLALGTGSGIFALLVHSLFDFNLQLPSNALLFLILTAVASNIGAAVSDKERVSLTALSRDREAVPAALRRGV